MADKKTWDDLTGAQRAGIGLLGVVQLGLLVAVQIDLTRRTDEQVNGPGTADHRDNRFPA